MQSNHQPQPQPQPHAHGVRQVVDAPVVVALRRRWHHLQKPFPGVMALEADWYQAPGVTTPESTMVESGRPTWWHRSPLHTPTLDSAGHPQRWAYCPAPCPVLCREQKSLLAREAAGPERVRGEPSPRCTFVAAGTALDPW